MTIMGRYTKDFKLEAIDLGLEQEYAKAEASRNFEINPNLIT